MASWDDVRRLVAALPETNEETNSSGHAKWTVNGKLIVWERPLRASDIEALGDAAPSGPILGVRTADLEMKEALLASDPKVFFTTPHFDGYASVLIRLGQIAPRALQAVVLEAWLLRAPKRALEAYLPPAAPAKPAKRGVSVKKKGPARKT